MRETEREPFESGGTAVQVEPGEGDPNETVEEIAVPDYVVRDFDAPEEASPARSGQSHVETRDAARLLGVSQRAVRNLVGRKVLEGKRDGEGAAARFMVSVASVERLRSEWQREPSAADG